MKSKNWGGILGINWFVTKFWRSLKYLTYLWHYISALSLMKWHHDIKRTKIIVGSIICKCSLKRGYFCKILLNQILTEIYEKLEKYNIPRYCCRANEENFSLKQRTKVKLNKNISSLLPSSWVLYVQELCAFHFHRIIRKFNMRIRWSLGNERIVGKYLVWVELLDISEDI